MAFPETSTLIFKSPKGVEFVARMVEHKGGVNDYGWWIVQAERTGEIFSVYVGRDVNDSQLLSGGKILERFDKEIHTEDDVRERMQKLINSNMP